MLRIWKVRWRRRLMRRDLVGGPLGSNIPKMFLPAAMLAEQGSWKGTPAGLAARNVMSFATRTVCTSSPS
jgi:hypothetical protein